LLLFIIVRGGDNWTDHTGWNVTNTPCGWYGVTCSSGHVSKIDLYSNQLSGTIPPELGQLSNLESLSLRANQLSGSIPPELGQLSSLQYLTLSSNQFSGNIPPELGQLSSLMGLILNNNQLSGSIPPELGQLSNLLILFLRNNQLSGTIPPELGQLNSLRGLELQNNQLSGPIPPELAQLSSLTSLFLKSNQLCGKIPSELMNLTNLDSQPNGLRLQNNNLINTDSVYEADFITWLDQNYPDWRNQVSPSYCSSLQFSATNYNVNEGDGTTTITVTRANNGAISANYATSNGTATAGSDYTQTTGTLSWGDGDLADKTFTIAITDDGDSEGTETFTITLTDPISGENLDHATITITDDDTTLVTLTEFTATALENEIIVEWQTTTELDNAGFHLWRATGEGWKYGDYSTVIRLTEQLMPAQGDFSVYSYRDADVETGVTYYYGLEDIDLNGQSTFHWSLIDSATAE